MQKNIDYNYNVDPYKNKFIDAFLKIFPNIYTKEQLDGILRNNVRDIEYIPIIKDCNGNYEYSKRKITLNVLEDRVIFHEFIHGIRGNEEIDKFYENVGIVEAFTSYAERIYSKCNKNNFSINYDNSKYALYRNRKKRIELLSTPETISSLAQQLEFLNFLTGSEESILTVFLKRGNIYNKIKDIYIKYYESIDSTKTEKDAKIATIKLVKKLNNIYLLIEKINKLNIEYNIRNHEYTLKEIKKDKENLIEEVNYFEQETEKIFRVLNKNNALDSYNMISIINYLPTDKEILFYTLYGIEPDEKKL